MADKFCSNCGTPNSEEAKFCVSCGTPAAAPQPVQPPTAPMEQPMQPQPQPFPQAPQPYQQAQPYAQPYPMAPAPPPAPAKKKKRTGLIVLGALGGFVLLIVIIVIAAASSLNKAANADYYQIKDDQVPSIGFVLGEKRNLIRTETSVRNGMTIVSREYQSSTYRQDIDAYFNYLVENAGWTPLYDGNMEFAGVGRNSVTPGYQLEVQAAYTASGYIISVYYLKGQLEMLNNPGGGRAPGVKLAAEYKGGVVTPYE